MAPQVECGVCNEFFVEGEREPHMLHCGHSFCMTCLQQLEVPKGGRRLRCPSCQRDLVLTCPLAELPKNFFGMEVIRQQNADHAARSAAAAVAGHAAHGAGAGAASAGAMSVEACPCSDDVHPAVLYCVTCEDHLCDAFAAIHRRAKGTAAHALVRTGGDTRVRLCWVCGALSGHVCCLDRYPWRTRHAQLPWQPCLYAARMHAKR